MKNYLIKFNEKISDAIIKLNLIILNVWLLLTIMVIFLEH